MIQMSKIENCSCRLEKLSDVLGNEVVLKTKTKRAYNSKLKALHGAFLPNVKYFGNKVGT